MHLHGPDRVGQRRLDDLNVWSERKRREKLNCAHGNAMKNRASQLSLLVTCHCALATALAGRGQAAISLPWTKNRSNPTGCKSIVCICRDGIVRDREVHRIKTVRWLRAPAYFASLLHPTQSPHKGGAGKSSCILYNGAGFSAVCAAGHCRRCSLAWAAWQRHATGSWWHAVPEDVL